MRVIGGGNCSGIVGLFGSDGCLSCYFGGSRSCVEFEQHLPAYYGGDYAAVVVMVAGINEDVGISRRRQHQRREIITVVVVISEIQSIKWPTREVTSPHGSEKKKR